MNKKSDSMTNKTTSNTTQNSAISLARKLANIPQNGRFKGIQTTDGRAYNTNEIKVTSFQLEFRDRNSGKNHRVPKYKVAELTGV